MIYVMADIHGFKLRFDDMLRQLDLQPSDHLYILGDVIDRRPHGIAILQQIMSMDNVSMILGNHEYMMLEAVTKKDDPLAENLWHYNGGYSTHQSFARLPKDTAAEIVQYLKSLPINIELSVNDQKFLLVHGAPESTYDPKNSTYEDSIQHAVWQRITSFDSIASQDTIIFGHTPTSHYQRKRPLSIWHDGNLIGIDCGCATNPFGRLACLRLDDMKEFYSSVNTYDE